MKIRNLAHLVFILACVCVQYMVVFAEDETEGKPKTKKLNLNMPQRNPSSLAQDVEPANQPDPSIKMEFLNLDVTTDPNYGKH